MNSGLSAFSSGVKKLIRNSFAIGLLGLIYTSFVFAQDNGTIRRGLDFLTTSAIEGPTLDCNEPSMALGPGFSENGADCTAFIRPDGKLGELGDVIVQHINSMDDTLFYDRDLSVVEVCPNWPTLNKEQKGYFWVWLFASISMKESTCGAAKINRDATHGTAVGLLQLNQSRRDRSWRGGESGDSCAVKDISKDEDNLKCGIEILHEQLKGKEGLYEGNGNLFGRGANSYWQGLRSKDGGKIMDLVGEFPYCK